MESVYLYINHFNSILYFATCWSGPSDVEGGCYDNQESQQDGKDTEDSEWAEGQNPEEETQEWRNWESYLKVHQTKMN